MNSINCHIIVAFPVEMEDKRVSELKDGPWIFLTLSFYAILIKGEYSLGFIQI